MNLNGGKAYGCYLATYGELEHGDRMTPCLGSLVMAHLIPKQLLKREGLRIWDQSVWVLACGGMTGSAGHHGAFDVARTLRLPRQALPERLEEFAEAHGISYWLDREYGPRP
jgi:uncharacterized protein CbrC (UPF0167 family)